MSERDIQAGRLTGAVSFSPASSPGPVGEEAVAASSRSSANTSKSAPAAITSQANYFLPETPASPPLTASGSQAELTHATPRPNAFTPPDSAPMSADPSQNPLFSSNEPQKLEEIKLGVSDHRSRMNLQETSGVAEGVVLAEEPPATDPISANTQPSSDQDGVPVDGLQREPLQLDWSLSNHAPFYKTGETSHKRMNALFSRDVFDVYGIQQIAADVARYHTTTGEKNPLRKTYQNFIKDISGKNKPIAKPQELTDLLILGDEDWRTQSVVGKSIESSLSPDLLAKLEKAVQMEPAKISRDENEKWKAVLDLDEVSAKPPTWPQNLNNHAPPKPPLSANAVLSPEPSRVSRRGTKRRYDEDSFEGYGEGYIDDAVDSPDAELDEDERRNSGKKKRRRDTGGTSTSVFSDKLGPLNTSRISVGNGSYPNR